MIFLKKSKRQKKAEKRIRGLEECLTTINKTVRILTRPHARLSSSPRSNNSTENDLWSNNNTNIIRYLQRPWRRIKKRHRPEAIFILAKRNYKVLANIGVTRRATQRFETILDTGAGSSFIRTNVLPDELLNKIRPLDDEPVIRDAGNRRVALRGSINLTVELGTRVEFVPFLVVDRLSTQVILGCDFCDKHCLLYTSPSPRDLSTSRMPSSA